MHIRPIDTLAQGAPYPDTTGRKFGAETSDLPYEKWHVLVERAASRYTSDECLTLAAWYERKAQDTSLPGPKRAIASIRSGDYFTCALILDSIGA